MQPRDAFQKGSGVGLGVAVAPVGVGLGGRLRVRGHSIRGLAVVGLVIVVDDVVETVVGFVLNLVSGRDDPQNRLAVDLDVDAGRDLDNRRLVEIVGVELDADSPGLPAKHDGQVDGYDRYVC